MKIITKITVQLCLLLFTFMLNGCTADNDTPKAAAKTNKPLPEDHFLTEKLETIKKAEAVGQIIQDAAAQQRRNIEDQGG